MQSVTIEIHLYTHPLSKALGAANHNGEQITAVDPQKATEKYKMETESRQLGKILLCGNIALCLQKSGTLHSEMEFEGGKL